MDKEPPDEGSFWQGLLLGFTLNLIAALLACGALGSSLSLRFLLAIGATQLIYLGPLMFYLYRTGRGNTAMGVVVIAGLTVPLNTTCLGLAGRFNGTQ
jgi:hypothetical protein